MNKDEKKEYKRNAIIVARYAILYAAVGLVGGISGGGGLKNLSRHASSDFFRGQYKDLRVMKRVSEDETKIMINYKDRHSIADPFLYANILPDSTITNISEHMTWAHKGVGELHIYANPRDLEEAAQSATNKIGSLAKWFGSTGF